MMRRSFIRKSTGGPVLSRGNDIMKIFEMSEVACMEEQKEKTEWERIKWFLQMTATGEFLFVNFFSLLYVMMSIAIIGVTAIYLQNILTKVMCLLILILEVSSMFILFLYILIWYRKGFNVELKKRGYQDWQLNEVRFKEKYGVELPVSAGWYEAEKIRVRQCRKEINKWVNTQKGKNSDGVLWFIKNEYAQWKIRRNKRWDK